ncbi:hypothetical protein PHMEG_00018031 [Phytophthora megakarya]|uniref:Uncharacterized protein n=1 Tax=Phytophthora megakarya TaxID=4795 RepID=A0A225VVU5_9STRA|nr:hypothetical protein PHMEG_00018031 [Phytophthora megakarya]
MDIAAVTGHWDIVIWLHSLPRIRCAAAAMANAATGCYHKVVEWLRANRTEGCPAKVLNCAAINAHINVAEWLLVNRSKRSHPVIFLAMKGAIMGEPFEVMWRLDAQRCDHSVRIDQIRDRISGQEQRLFGDL